MHVALIGAEFEENLAIRSIQGALEDAGHTVLVVVFNGPEDTDRAARELAGSGAALAGLSMVFTYRAREFADLATRARALGYSGRLVAGGHFASFHAEALLVSVPAIDAVVCGEGEQPMRALAARPGAPEGVPGLVWRGDDGALRRTEEAVKPPDLDALPWPHRRRPYDRCLGLPIVNMLGSRGCTHSCSFCSIAAWHRLCGGARLRLRAPAAVAEEMATLWRDGVRIFNFHDDNFILPRADATRVRVAALAAELAERGVGRIAFAIKARPDGVDERLFRELRALGLFRVFLGIEAGTDESLRHLGRGQRLADNVRALDTVNRLGLHACFNLLLWNPDSTLEDVAANVAFLRAHPANPMNFCRTEVYAGTPIEARLRAADRLEGDLWAPTYTMTDARAQTAFELVYAAFEGRSFPSDCVQHRAMEVDYEFHLLEHFHGPQPDLRRRVKAYVRTVNRDTCDRLDEILAASERAVDDPAAPWAALPAIRERLAVANRRLQAEGCALVDLARARARSARRPLRRRHAWLPRARKTAAGLAAGAALFVAACRTEDSRATEEAPLPTDVRGPGRPLTQPTEMVAVPPEPRAAPDTGAARAPTPSDAVAPVPPRVTERPPLPPARPPTVRPQATEYAPLPPRPTPPRPTPPLPTPAPTPADARTPPPDAGPTAPDAGPAQIDDAELREIFRSRGFSDVARLAADAEALAIEVWLDPAGRVVRAEVRAAGLAAAAREDLAAYVRAFDFQVPVAPDRHATFTFTREELRAQRIRDTRVFEEAARPPKRRR